MNQDTVKLHQPNIVENYDYDFWFNQEEEHGDDIAKFGYGKNFYAYRIFEQVVTQLTDIPDGYIVVLGSRMCQSFDFLCNHFGRDRCVGYDLHNPTGHDRVRVKNCLELDSSDDIPIAFVHNDVGTWPHTPKLKLHAQIWATRNIVPGGYCLGRNNLNSQKIDLEKFMSDQGFDNLHLRDFPQDQLVNIAEHHVVSHMLSRKRSNTV